MSVRGHYHASLCVITGVFYYCRTYYKAVRVGGGGEWRTCAMRDDEPRPVWMSLPIMGPVRNPVLEHRVRLFSLVPLVWESNPKLQGGWCKPTTSPSGDLIPTIRGSGAHPGAGCQFVDITSPRNHELTGFRGDMVRRIRRAVASGRGRRLA